MANDILIVRMTKLIFAIWSAGILEDGGFLRTRTRAADQRFRRLAENCEIVARIWVFSRHLACRAAKLDGLQNWLEQI